MSQRILVFVILVTAVAAVSGSTITIEPPCPFNSPAGGVCAERFSTVSNLPAPYPRRAVFAAEPPSQPPSTPKPAVPLLACAALLALGLAWGAWQRWRSVSVAVLSHGHGYR